MPLQSTFIVIKVSSSCPCSCLLYKEYIDYVNRCPVQLAWCTINHDGHDSSLSKGTMQLSQNQ